MLFHPGWFHSKWNNIANDHSNKNDNEIKVEDKKTSKWESFQTAENRNDDERNNSDKENLGTIVDKKYYQLVDEQEIIFFDFYAIPTKE